MFKFKQFEVDQQHCAMKINTDGVLLAALVQCFEPKKILDIGTGTGVLALMLAQRFPNAMVEAVEIDEQAAATARNNFERSPFKERLKLHHLSIEAFQCDENFDLIITNPPFFVNDLKNAEAKKGLARHASEQFFSDLIEKVNAILSNEGSFWFILPVKQAEALIAKAIAFDLSAATIIKLHSDISKPPFRFIVQLSRGMSKPAAEHFYIYESEKTYTNRYREVLKDFFLEY